MKVCERCEIQDGNEHYDAVMEKQKMERLRCEWPRECPNGKDCQRCAWLTRDYWERAEQSSEDDVHAEYAFRRLLQYEEGAVVAAEVEPLLRRFEQELRLRFQLGVLAGKAEVRS